MKLQRNHFNFTEQEKNNMITFTLRLQELEAEALERLSFVYGTSKNRLINSLIAKEYESFINGEETTPTDTELLYISYNQDFPDTLEDCFGAMPGDEIGKDNLKKIIKCYDYAIEHDEGNNGDKLEAQRGEWVEVYKNLSD